jgi:hypothetical protein
VCRGYGIRAVFISLDLLESHPKRFTLLHPSDFLFASRETNCSTKFLVEVVPFSSHVLVPVMGPKLQFRLGGKAFIRAALISHRS